MTKIPSEPKFKLRQKVYTLKGLYVIELTINRIEDAAEWEKARFNCEFIYGTVENDTNTKYGEDSLFATKQELKDFIFKQ